ncbi:MAG TPA: peroxiredoxin [Polyangiaceae bacterium]|nr:peroxiredoxin [Polyangiaceae bacterium]
MVIKVGDKLPDATVTETTEFGEACPVGPQKLSVAELAQRKKVVLFGVPGAYTPTCSAKHLPGYVQNLEALRAKGVDEVWCVSVNDGFVMAAWGREHGAIGRVRMLGDGAAEFTRKLGLDTEIPSMGVRSRRFSILVDDGVVKQVNVEEPGKFVVSNVETMLEQLG